MKPFLMLLIRQVISYLLPLLEKYVEETDTTIDDTLVNQLRRILTDQGFLNWCFRAKSTMIPDQMGPAELVAMEFDCTPEENCIDECRDELEDED